MIDPSNPVERAGRILAHLREAQGYLADFRKDRQFHATRPESTAYRYFAERTRMAERAVLQALDSYWEAQEELRKHVLKGMAIDLFILCNSDPVLGPLRLKSVEVRG